MKSVRVRVDGKRRATTIGLRPLVSIVVLLLVFPAPVACQSGRIDVLLVGHMVNINALRRLVLGEPLLSFTVVPCWVIQELGLTFEEVQKYVRLYFPRTYEEMSTYDFVILGAVEYELLTARQDRLIYDVIREGAGGVNDGSVFSIVGTTITAWESSMASKAFPNDVSAVAGRGWRSGQLSFRVRVNRDFRDPVLTLFLPYGVERAPCWGVSGMVIPREGAGTLAWQEGNFPTRQCYLAVWDYEKGRTYTCGSYIPGGWFSYPENAYSPEILINMIFYATKRKVIQDVEVFHAARSSVMEFGNRMGVLVSIKEFVDRFGANTASIEDRIFELEALYREGVEHYASLDFSRCREHMEVVLEQFTQAEKVAMELKDRALLWVYLIEWLVVSATSAVVGVILWSIMVRRRLYREVETTRFEA